MSLRDAIKNLRNIAKRLDNANFNPQMTALEKFLDGLKVDKPALPPEDVLEKLLQKFLRGEQNFSAREVRALPFIIHKPEITSHDTAKILRLMDFSRTSHLRGVLIAYLSKYDDSNKTELLRQTLNSLRGIESPSLIKVFAARENLFGDRRFTNMTKIFAQKLSVATVLAEFGLSDFYKASNFIQTAIKIFFRTNTPLAAQFKILDELDAEFDTYKNIFPAVADALIQTVARTSFGKNRCVEIFYRRLGDPRFGDSQSNWRTVSPKSVEIFSQWLSEDDLETFFKLISDAAVDTNWKYREKFWRAYLPYITKTKIFLGTIARTRAAQLKDNATLRHGNLTGAMATQSVFVFQIGQYIFSEWSHAGKLRVHNVTTTVNLFDMTEDFFNRVSINRKMLVNDFVAEWKHHSPQSHFWQKQVSEWLKVNCGVNKTKKDWELEH